MELTEQYLRKIVAKSLFIHELRGDRVKCRETDQSPNRLKRWEDRVGESVFEQRLQLEGVSTGEALYLCGEPEYTATTFPQWTETLKEVFALLPTSLDQILQETNPRYCHDTYPTIIGNCFLLFAVFAKRKLGKFRDKVDDALFETLYRDLIDRLCLIGGNAMHDYIYHWIGDQSEASDVNEKMKANPCDFLLAGGYLGFFSEYPVLARLLCQSTHEWIGNMDDLLSRALRDIPCGGRLSSIVGGISDLHNGGKNVYVLKYGNKEKRVYKPRSLRIDLAWEKLCRKLREQTGIDLKCVESSDYGPYGFCEFIEYKSAATEEGRKRFFENAGSLLCVLYLLRARDMHNDNVICHDDKLVVIDMETVAQSDTDSYSVINTAMLNTWVVKQRSPFDFLDEGNGGPDDLGGLTCKLSHTKNLPMENDTVHTAKSYINEVCHGFETMYDRVMNGCDFSPGEYFTDCDVRYLFRKTDQYFDLLMSLYDCEHLGDGFIFSCEVERLASACTPDYFAAYLSEREAIFNGDTPVFFQKAGTHDLYDGNGLVIRGYFKHKVGESAPWRTLDEEDKQKQLALIRKIQ